MDTATAELNIELNIECPCCENSFDMVTQTDLNDDGWLLDQALPDEPWVDAHQRFETEVTCPKCKTAFRAKGIDW
jgi:C4-type Zn-finger protein